MKSLGLYKKLYLIRRSEQQIIDHYVEDQMKTPMHMSAGQEAIAVGVLAALPDDAPITTTYRTHAIYLTRTGNTDKFFLELFGKSGGTSNGKAGSMHLLSPEHALSCTTAIVGTNIPVAAGIALANKMNNINNPVVVFFGDGAVDEGVFWETLNFAALKKLNMLFVYEDNNFAVHVPKSERHAYREMLDVVSHFNYNTFYDHSNDVEKIYDITTNAISASADNGMPSFLHFECSRYLEHVGVFKDLDAGYRNLAEYKDWLNRDPLDIQRQKVIKMLGIDEVQKVEGELDKKILDSFEKAQNASFPSNAELYTGVFK